MRWRFPCAVHDAAFFFVRAAPVLIGSRGGVALQAKGCLSWSHRIGDGLSSPEPDGSAAAATARLLSRARRPPRLVRVGPLAVGVLIALAGAAVSGLASVTAYHLDQSTERRLLDVQTRQAAALISSAIASIEAPLQTALEIAEVTGGTGAAVTTYLTGQAGKGGPFVSASVWHFGVNGPTRIAAVGHPIPADQSTQMALINQAHQARSLAVSGLPVQELDRIGYALADRSQMYVVYAVRAIPPDRQVPVEKNSAFSELNYATYLGASTTAANLATTDVEAQSLPLSGHTSRQQIPFGNSVITLVTAARGHLGGTLESELWWLALLVGAVLTVGAAGASVRLARRRIDAEADTQTIGELYERLDDQYGEQRSISLTLQNALLPQTNPDIPGLQIASRYVAGVDGVEVGGDWFSVVAIDEESFAFVVGDVSGRGVRAAAVMARMRFTLRAYLAEGHPPEVALQLAARQLDIQADGHLATTLVGVGRPASREVVLASAGHPPPLLLADGRAEFLDLPVGRPLGVYSKVRLASQYTSVTRTMTPGSVLFVFTDGLVERRDEPLDVGFERLRGVVQSAGGSLDEVVDDVVHTMAGDGAADDLAILALRWL